MTNKARVCCAEITETLKHIAEKKIDIFCPVEMTSLRIFNRCHPGLIEFGYFQIDLTAKGMALIK